MRAETVGDLALDAPVRLPAGATVREAAACMQDERVSCVFVGPLMAVVTEHDFAGALASGLDRGAPLEQIATPTPVWVTTSSSVVDAVSIMVGHHVRHLVVLSSQGVLLGTLSLTAASAALLDQPVAPPDEPGASDQERQPEHVRSEGLRTIAVGFDGSPDSVAALRWACVLARLCGARVVVAHATGLLEYPYADRVMKAIEDQARSVVREAGGCTGSLDFHVVEGDPCSVLRQVAQPPTQADLLVLGSRGHTAHRDVAIGSTGYHMVESGLVPVVIVPTQDEEARHLSSS